MSTAWPTTGRRLYPQVSLGSAGDATALWQEYVSGNFVLEAGHGPAGGAFDTPTTLSGAGTVTIDATVDAATAKRLGLKGLRLASAIVKTKGAARPTTVALKLPASVRARLQRLKGVAVTLTATFRDAKGATHTTTSTLAAYR